eukprot:3576498-Rhodomonas_salina.1
MSTARKSTRNTFTNVRSALHVRMNSVRPGVSFGIAVMLEGSSIVCSSKAPLASTPNRKNIRSSATRKSAG